MGKIEIGRRHHGGWVVVNRQNNLFEMFCLKCESFKFSCFHFSFRRARHVKSVTRGYCAYVGDQAA